MLGLIWLLDAALQYQPYMFTRAFPDQAITPAGQGSPWWVASPVRWSGELMAHHIVFWNSVFATVQLALAVGLFFRKTTRVTLASSVVWAVLVWWLGEGLGGILAGPQSPVAGLPGAVIVYALIAVLLWPPRAAARMTTTSEEGQRNRNSVAETSPLTAVGARAVWVVFWAVFVFETLRPADRARHGLSQLVLGMAAGEPGWLASVNRWASHALVGDGTVASIVLAAVFVALAACVFVPLGRRPVLVVGIVLALAIWVIGQDLGEIATGEATDPNSGLLLALLALCYWPVRNFHAHPND